MPDVFDPYEERGVPNPHEQELFDEQPWQHGYGSSNIPAPKMTKTEIDRERRRIIAKAKKKIRPGFYEGSEPLSDGLEETKATPKRRPRTR